jgi:Flp pilus assembly protein TadG
MINHRSSRAQAMVEFALALPVFLFILYGLIEASRLIFIVTTVSSAAREGARYASAGGGMYRPVTPAQFEDCDGIRAAARKVGFLLNLQDSDVTIVYDHGTNGTDFASCPATGGFAPSTAAVVGGDRVLVTVSYNYQPILVNFLPFTNFTLSSPRTARTLTGLVDMNR